MSEQAKRRDLFLQGLDRCTDSDDFINAFYTRFLSTSEEVREKFRKTDFEQQNKMLVRYPSTADDSRRVQKPTTASANLQFQQLEVVGCEVEFAERERIIG